MNAPLKMTSSEWHACPQPEPPRILPVISVQEHMACAAIPPAGLPHMCETDRDEGNTNQFVSNSLSGEMAMLQVQKMIHSTKKYHGSAGNVLLSGRGKEAVAGLYREL